MTKNPLDTHFKKAMREKHVCYVLITCNEPLEDGSMQVEMTYEGDEELAAFLLANANQVFDEKRMQQESQ